MRDYQKLMESVHVPEGLDARVLAVAEAGTRQNGTEWQRFLRRAVCAVCALALVLGTFSLRQVGDPDDDTPGPLLLTYEFGITANAKDRAANGGLVIRWEDGCGSFQITGSDIESVCLRTDRGILLRNGLAVAGEICQEFVADTVYGIMPSSGSGMEQLDGAELTLSVTFADGAVETKTYRLTAENLRMFRNADGGEVLVPALAGDGSPTMSALYASGADSRWLLWPVAGSNTVSLSQPYGDSMRPIGGEPVFHAGIDIPGKEGMEIVAAADGAVVKTGYDSILGYWLRIDHSNGLTTYYSSYRESLVNEGDPVAAGEVIALMGSTGMSTGPHLHFEVKEDGVTQNPVAYFHSDVRDTLQAR